MPVGTLELGKPIWGTRKERQKHTLKQCIHWLNQRFEPSSQTGTTTMLTCFISCCAGTEQHIGENGLGGVVPDKTDPYMWTDLPVWNFTAALGLAKGINQGYLTANQTAVLIWTPTCECLTAHMCPFLVSGIVLQVSFC